MGVINKNLEIVGSNETQPGNSKVCIEKLKKNVRQNTI